PRRGAAAGCGRRAAELPRVASARRRRGTADAVPGRNGAAVAAPVPDGRRHARAAHARASRLRPVPAAAAPLPPRRGAVGAGGGRLDARRLPDAAPHDARRARRVRRGVLPLRRGHRPLLPRGAGGVGALVRAGGGRRARASGGDRPALPHAADAVALARHPALRAQAPRAPARALVSYRVAPGSKPKFTSTLSSRGSYCEGWNVPFADTSTRNGGRTGTRIAFDSHGAEWMVVRRRAIRRPAAGCRSWLMRTVETRTTMCDGGTLPHAADRLSDTTATPRRAFGPPKRW